ncbi:PREDICTED: uncharacterized protein LOC109484581 [Branchiostoma belcheri]|uniref:Uncharacterized protein LOC109484581 n=1 Tax=Branchiostoma belcheri TaxID=7741 RepID=A0A6P5A2A8_BRABE|nr:PREDICTED: uncharacterized protein LOC109484581 [Branchiostoma belcheri]
MLCLPVLYAGLVFWASSGLAEEAPPGDYSEYGEVLDLPPTCDVMFLKTCEEEEDGCILATEHRFTENGTTIKLQRRQCTTYSNCQTAQLLYHNSTNLAYFQLALGKNFTMDIHCCQGDGCNEVADVAMTTGAAMTTGNSTAMATTESKCKNLSRRSLGPQESYELTMKFVFAVVTVSAVLAGAAALKCYQCSLKDSDANCNSGGPSQCSNAEADTCTTLSAKSGKLKTITKSCGLRENCGRLSMLAAATTCKASLENVSGCLECCQGDGCNSVTSFRSDGAITSVSVMATVTMATLACIVHVM